MHEQQCISLSLKPPLSLLPCHPSFLIHSTRLPISVKTPVLFSLPPSRFYYLRYEQTLSCYVMACSVSSIAQDSEFLMCRPSFLLWGIFLFWVSTRLAHMGFVLIFVVSFSLCGYLTLCFLLVFILPSSPRKVVGWWGLTFIRGERIELLSNGGFRFFCVL